MVYRILADLLVIVHFSFVLFVVLGGVLAWRWQPIMWVHLPAVVWGVLIEWAGWICPLTPFENWLREMGEEAEYIGSFVEHYLITILYPEDLTRELQITLGFVVLAINVLIYWRALSHSREVL
jgi:hypothetical protein